MTKNTISVSVDEFGPSELEGSLGDLKARVQSWIDTYGENAYLNWDRWHHNMYDPEPSPQYELRITRKETDEEEEVRVRRDAQIKAEQRQRDLNELARLKKLLGE